MLEHVPGWLGALFRNVRAGHSKLVIVDPDLGLTNTTLSLQSPAFADGARLPERFTADGEGVSPPLVWGQVPEDAAGLALIVEDPDAPALHPFVHAIVWGMPVETTRLEEGALNPGPQGGPAGDIGSSAILSNSWTPPDPPTGHGPHDYVFQLFALSDVPHIGSTPSRSDVVSAIRGRIVAAGMLVGTYSRGEQVIVGGSSRAALGGAAI